MKSLAGKLLEKLNKINESDEVSGDVLAEYAVNSDKLFKIEIKDMINLLADKISKSIYKKDRALKLWKSVADYAAKMYKSEFGKDATEGARKYVAEFLARHYAEDVVRETNRITGTKENTYDNKFREIYGFSE